MTIFSKLGNDIASPVDASGATRPVDNMEMQVWMTEVESIVDAFTSNGGTIFVSKASMDANLGYPQFTMAWVLGDATAANNGIYRKIGSSGTGSWARSGDLPYSFIRASNAGAGTANAIVATTSTPIPVADGAALIALPITADNDSSPVTVAFNGGSPLTIKTSAGNDVAIGGLVTGMIVAGYKSGSTFRLLTDQASAAVLAEMEALFVGAHSTAPTVDPNGNPLQAGALYYNTASGIVFVWDGAAWQAMNATVGDETITDAKIAKPSLLRNRNLDQVFLTDAFSAAVQDDIRDGDTVDLDDRMQWADNKLANGGQLYAPKGNYRVNVTTAKHPATWWYCDPSNTLLSVTPAFASQGTRFIPGLDGDLFTITGAVDGSSNRKSMQGGIYGARIEGNRSLFPNAVGIRCENVFTHYFQLMRIGELYEGIVSGDVSGFGKAFYLQNLYVFGCTRDGVRLNGSAPKTEGNSDHWISQCQFTGSRYGLNLVNMLGANMMQNRPQGSGVANVNIEGSDLIKCVGGFSDTGSTDPVTGGGLAFRIANSTGVEIKDYTMYSNGNGSPHIQLLANNDVVSDINISGNIFRRGNGQTGITGVAFSSLIGTGAFRRINLFENNGVSVDQLFSGLQNIGQELHHGGNVYPASASGVYASIAETGSAITCSPDVAVAAVAGAAAAYDFIIPSAGNYRGKTFSLRRTGGTGGAITMKSEAGTTVAIVPTVANANQTVVCTGSSPTASSVTWAPLGT